MNRYFLLAAAAAIAGASAPAAGQTPDPYPQSPIDPAAPNALAQVIDGLLGKSYPAAADRAGVLRCASAALAHAALLYGINGYAGSNGYAGYVGAYRPGAVGVPGYPGVVATMRLSAITHVQRRWDGMRVKGLIDSGVDYLGGQGGQAYQGAGPGGQAYATRYPSHNDLSFRCNLDPHGIVTSMHVDRNTTTYRRF